jgi:hypothetical protein
MAYDQEKRKEFKKTDIKIRYIIIICVEDFDQETIQDIKSAKEMWDYLYNKYFDIRASVNSAHLVDLTTYKMGPEMQVSNTWIEIKRLRAKVVSSNKNIEKLFNKKEFFQILLRALPKEYKVIRDSISTFQGPVDERIRIIQDKKDYLRRKDSVFAVFQRKYQPGRTQ